MNPTPTQDTSDGAGIIGRGGYLAGKTFGRQGSITPLEVMPYMLSDEHFIFPTSADSFQTTPTLAGTLVSDIDTCAKI